MVDQEERNWKVFITKIIGDWHGVWTRYEPDGKLSQSFQSLRKFSILNDAKTQVRQINRYSYPDGKVEEKSWDTSRSKNSFSDGFIYGSLSPEAANYRVALFESGEVIWRPIHLKNVTNGFELIFLHDNLRVSAGVTYKNGNISRVACIREDCLGFPGQHWSKDMELVSERSFTGNWEGTSTIMYSDLTLSKPVVTKHQWGCWEGHHIYYMPDGVTVSCPMTLPAASDLVIVANWLVSDKEMHQMSVLYNEAGDFVSQTLDVLKLD